VQRCQGLLLLVMQLLRFCQLLCLAQQQDNDSSRHQGWLTQQLFVWSCR
jgi:hypothetical protein